MELNPVASFLGVFGATFLGLVFIVPAAILLPKLPQVATLLILAFTIPHWVVVAHNIAVLL